MPIYIYPYGMDWKTLFVRGQITYGYRWFSPDVTAAMLVYRRIEENVFWEFDSIIMQNMSHNLLLFCTQTWPPHHVIENHLYMRTQGCMNICLNTLQ